MPRVTWLFLILSAVLAWLLGEGAGRRVREVLRRAELMMASDTRASRVRSSADPRGHVREVLETHGCYQVSSV